MHVFVYEIIARATWSVTQTCKYSVLCIQICGDVQTLFNIAEYFSIRYIVQLCRLKHHYGIKHVETPNFGYVELWF